MACRSRTRSFSALAVFVASATGVALLPNTSAAVTPSTNAVVTVAGLSGPRGVAVSPDGLHVWVTNTSSNNVSEIDATSNPPAALEQASRGSTPQRRSEPFLVLTSRKSHL